MVYREIVAVCPQIHTKHTNTLCVEQISTKLAVPNFTRTYTEYNLKTLNRTRNLTKDKFGEVLKRAYDGGLYCTISTVVTTECS